MLDVVRSRGSIVILLMGTGFDSEWFWKVFLDEATCWLFTSGIDTTHLIIISVDANSLLHIGYVLCSLSSLALVQGLGFGGSISLGSQ